MQKHCSMVGSKQFYKFLTGRGALPIIEGAQMGSSRRDRDIAKLRKNSQNVNRQICVRNFA